MFERRRCLLLADRIVEVFLAQRILRDERTHAIEIRLRGVETGFLLRVLRAFGVETGLEGFAIHHDRCDANECIRTRSLTDAHVLLFLLAVCQYDV